MKTLILLLLICVSGMAKAEEILCFRPGSPELSYRLSSSNLEDYRLTVTMNDGSQRVIYRDVMKGTDYQGALVLESKKTYMNLEDMDDVTYTYTKLVNGSFRTISEKLKCEVI